MWREVIILKFFGRLVGKALREGFIVPVPLSEEFFALVRGLDVKLLLQLKVSLLSKVSLLKIVPSLEVESGTNDIKNYI